MPATDTTTEQGRQDGGRPPRGKANKRKGPRWNSRPGQRSNGHHDRQQTTRGRTGTETDQIRQVIEGLGKSLADLSKRLVSIENGGPDRPQGRPAKSDHLKQAGPPTTLRSLNDDFGAMSKCLYRLVQLHHHEANWEKLPKSIDERLQKLADDIKPPMPDDDLRSALMAATLDYGERISKIVREHIRAKHIATQIEAAKLDRTDVDRAKEVAAKYLSTRLGKRLDASRRATMLDAAVNVVGMHRQPPPTVSETDADGFTLVTRSPRPQRQTSDTAPSIHKRKLESSPVVTDNAFQVLADIHAEPMTDEEEDVEGDAEAATEPSPPVRKPIKQPRRTPPTDSFRTKAGVEVFRGRKEEWSIQPAPGTKTIVIGDSNVRDAPKVPTDWEIFAMPGAKLQHVVPVLNQLRPTGTDNLQHIIIQVGINHRTSFSGDDVIEALTDIGDALCQVAIASTTFCGISMSSKRPQTELDRVDKINEHAKGIWTQENFIEPLSDDDIEIRKSDTLYGIHFTPETIDKIIQKMVAHDRQVFP